MKLRIVAGRDVTPRPAKSTPPAGDPMEFFDQVDELIQRYKEAYSAYRQAVADIAQRTGRTVSSVGHTFAAEQRRRTLRAARAVAAEQTRAEPCEAEDWCNLM
jgi:hypothetical protein